MFSRPLPLPCRLLVLPKSNRMNKKLKDDYIKFTLSLNTSEAREELNRLNASSRELQRTNDGLRNSMTELVASGKKGSDEYKRLEAELKSNSKVISDNNAKVKILRSSMKSTEKTYAELAKEARGLQNSWTILSSPFIRKNMPAWKSSWRRHERRWPVCVAEPMKLPDHS